MKTLYESILSSTGTGQYAKEIDGYHIGDIVVSVYHYSARIPNFYKIIDIKGKATVIVRRLETYNVSGDGQNGKCLPVIDKFNERYKELTVRVGRRGFRINDERVYKFEGKPEEFYTD